MEAAAELRAEGKTLLDRLDELFVIHGYFLEDQMSQVCEGPRGKDQIDRLMRAFREQPPTELAGLPLARVRDYGRHEIRELPSNARAADLPEPKSDLVFFESAPGDREVLMAIRPSGTEPKIKFYLFARAACPNAAALPETKAAAEAKLREVKKSLAVWIDSILAEAAA
jgi:phosphoglucomutase/phosphomannomutase